MAPRSRSFSGRIRDQLVFSVGAVLVLFIALRFLGVRSPVSSIFLSVVLTLALNVGMSYVAEARGRRDARSPERSHDPRSRERRDADIRWRDDGR